MITKVESLVLLSWLACVTADITVYSNKTHRQLDVEFRDLPARFGMFIPVIGLKAFLVYADPPDACVSITPAPPTTVLPNFTGRWAVLIKRYGCTFEEKVRNAQAANYDIAIVHNVNSSDLEPMSADDKRGIFIAAVFVSEVTGLILKSSYLYKDGFYIMVDDELPFDINTRLLFPFAIVVGLCFCTMLGFMVVKCIKDHRRARRHRLPSSSLRKIPIAKFRKGDPYETCAICLEDFVEEEKLRILPCSHAYHCKCIDPWLTRNRRVCPVCKRKVFAADEVRTNSDPNSDSESDVDDRTPLIRASGHTTQGGTFTSYLQEALRNTGVRRHSPADTESSSAGPSNSAPSIQHPEESQVIADINPEVVTSSHSHPPLLSTQPPHSGPIVEEAPNPFEDTCQESISHNDSAWS